MKEHTSLYLESETRAKLLDVGNGSINAGATKIFDLYFSGATIGEDKAIEELKKFLESEKAKAFFKAQMIDMMMTIMGAFMSNKDRDAIIKRMKYGQT